MNVRLQYDFDFLAAVWYDGELKLNEYSVSTQLLTASKNQHHINIAMERLKFFMFNTLENVIFVDETDADTVDMLLSLGMNICTLPSEPVDQIIGLALYCKLNAIMEKVLLVTDLNVSSRLGDSVWFQHDAEDDLGPFSKDGWWHEKSTNHDNLEYDEQPEKVVKVQTDGWSDEGLSWSDPEQKPAKVVDFKKHENK